MNAPDTALRELLGELWYANEEKNPKSRRTQARKKAARRAAELAMLLLSEDEPLPHCEGIPHGGIGLYFEVGEM